MADMTRSLVEAFLGDAQIAVVAFDKNSIAYGKATEMGEQMIVLLMFLVLGHMQDRG